MNICVFGDSIVWGAYDPENGGWATLLRNYFESADSPPYFREAGDVEVYNCGVSGDKTEDLLKRFEVEAQAREPNLIIFAIGINDSPILLSSNQRRVSDENFKNNIFKLHTHSSKFTQQIIFVGFTPIDDGKTSPWDDEKAYRQEGASHFDQIIQKYCDDNKLIYIPLQEVLSKKDLYDGLHPNTEGHRKIFEIIKPVVEKMLQYGGATTEDQ